MHYLEALVPLLCLQSSSELVCGFCKAQSCTINTTKKLQQYSFIWKTKHITLCRWHPAWIHSLDIRNCRLGFLHNNWPGCKATVIHRPVANRHYILPLAQLVDYSKAMDLVIVPVECSGAPPCSYIPILDASQLPLQQLDSLALSEDDGPQRLHLC